jgi:hypothetical protein
LGAAEEQEPAPGLAQKILKPWTLFRRSPEASPIGTSTNWKQLTLTMELDPVPLKVPENRQVKVTLQLANKGKKLVQLEFPTTQRIEVLVRNSSGKMVEQWSEDQSFSNEQTLVAINPNERLEYSVSVSTRDMIPGQGYSIEAFFPNYDQLKAIKSIVAEK